MKIVINRCYGVFCLSEQAYKSLGIEWDGYGYMFKGDRTNPRLIEVVERLGTAVASGQLAMLGVIEIPDGVEFEIHSYDGIETIHEKHRTWG